MRADAHAFAQVERVRAVALGAGIQLQLAAALAPGFRLEPVEQGLAVATAARMGVGHQVVHVQQAAMGQHFLHAPARECARRVILEQGHGMPTLGELAPGLGDETRFVQVIA